MPAWAKADPEKLAAERAKVAAKKAVEEAARLLRESKMNWIRKACLITYRNWWFNAASLSAIISFSILLAAADPTKPADVGRNAWISKIETGFTFLFTVEVLIVWTALGLTTFFDDFWNVLDWFIVGLGWLAFTPVDAQFGALRVIRLLRPLRTLKRVESMRRLVNSLLASLPGLVNVAGMMASFIFVCALFGVKLWKGSMRFGCVAHDDLLGDHERAQYLCELGRNANPNATVASLTDPEGRPNPEFADYTTADALTCNFVPNTVALEEVAGNCSCFTDQVCMLLGNPNHGITSFDNPGAAALSLVQVITLEGWTELMDRNTDIFNDYVVLLYYMIVVWIGAFFLTHYLLAQCCLVFMFRLKATEADEDDEAVAQPNPISRCMTFLKRKIKGRPKIAPVIDDGRPPSCFQSLRNTVTTFTKDERFDSFINYIILLNFLLLAIDHHGMDSEFADKIETTNVVLTWIFAAELLLKCFGWGPKAYFSDAFNCFDAFIVFTSLFEFFMALANPEGGGGGFSVLRTLRLLRIMRSLKVIKSMDTLKKMMATTVGSLVAIANFFFLLMLMLYIFALVGMQMFGGKVDISNGDLMSPRTNFDSMQWSFMTVFLIMTRENWQAVLYDIMDQCGSATWMYFYLVIIVTNYILLALFVGTLLENFEKFFLPQEIIDKRAREEFDEFDTDHSGWLDKEEARRYCASVGKDTKTFDEEWLRILTHCVTDENRGAGRVEFKEFESYYNLEAEERQALDDALATKEAAALAAKEGGGGGDTTPRLEDIPLVGDNATTPLAAKGGGGAAETPQMSKYKTSSAEELEQSGISDGVPERDAAFEANLSAVDKSAAGKQSGPFSCVRDAAHKVVEHEYFEAIVLFFIMASSLALAIEHPADEKESPKVKVLRFMDEIFLVFFTFEMLIKWVADGIIFSEGSYFRSGWNITDGFIVWSALITKMTGSEGGPLRVVRTVRVLRPLRAIQRSEGMRDMASSLLKSVPSVLTVLAIVLFFMIIVAIFCVQLFKGTMYHCNQWADVMHSPICKGEACMESFEASGAALHSYLSSGGLGKGSPKDECTGVWVDPSSGQLTEAKWANSDWHFDHLGSALLTLFEIFALEAWPDILIALVDATDQNHGPRENANSASCYLFVLIIMFGSFFLLNLFVGVIVTAYNEVQRDNVLDPQSEALKDAMIKVKDAATIVHSAAPKKLIYKEHPFRGPFMKIANHDYFEPGIMMLIVLNVVVMSTDWVDPDGTTPQALTDIVGAINDVFAIIFVLEVIIKNVAMTPCLYFRDSWCLFDFAISVTSGIDTFFTLPMNPTAIRIFRIFRLARLLRLSKKAKGLQTLVKTLVATLPSLMHVGFLLAIFFFMYAVLGVQLFWNVELSDNLTEYGNFKSFGNALVTLFRISTGEAWNGLMHACMITPENSDCVQSDVITENTCGNSGVAVFYFITFILACSMTTMNLIIAVILYSFFSFSKKEDEFELQGPHVFQFIETWSHWDQMATGKLSPSLLRQFLITLGEPMGVSSVEEAAELEDELWEARDPINNVNMMQDHNMELAFMDVLRALVLVRFEVLVPAPKDVMADEDDDAVKAPPQELGDLGEESEMLSPARDLSMANMSVTALDGSNIAPGEVNVPGAGER